MSSGASFDAKTRGKVGGLELIGVDEAGRGPWAGPVVVAAVCLRSHEAAELSGVRDSKLLSPARREELFEMIRLSASAIAVAWAHPREIERSNILRATLAAMRRAVLRLPRPGLVLVDGPHPIPDFPWAQRALIKGDRLSLSVASASIIAKVVRDRWMARLDRRFPGYGFLRHKGYGTAAHSEALRRLGPCPIHRRTYAPIRELLAR